TERVREVDLLHGGQLAATPERDGGGGPLADPVHREHHRFGERRSEERAGRVAQVMLAEEYARAPVDVGRESPQLPHQVRLLEQLLAAPHRHRHAERTEPGGGERQVRLEETLELEEGLVVERDMVDLGRTDLRRLQTVFDGVMREARVVLLPGEALLLGRRDDPAVLAKSPPAAWIGA